MKSAGGGVGGKERLHFFTAGTLSDFLLELSGPPCHFKSSRFIKTSLPLDIPDAVQEREREAEER